MTQPETNVRRVYQTYLYATCFVTILFSLVAGAVALKALMDIVFPSLASQGPASYVRDRAAATLVTSLIFGGVAFGVFGWHWLLAKRVREEMNVLTRAPLPSIAEPMTVPDVPAETPVQPRPRAPRARRSPGTPPTDD